MWTFWYIREASTAILVANIPNCWPLLRRIFNLRSFSGSSDPTSGTHNRNPMSASRLAAVAGLQGVKIASNDPNGGRTWGGRDKNRMVAKSESLEYINGRLEDGTMHKEIPLEIWQDVEVSIHKFDAEDEESVRRKEMYDGVENGDEELGFKSKTKTVVTAQGV